MSVAERARALMADLERDELAELLALAVAELLDEDGRKLFVEALDTVTAAELRMLLADEDAE